MHLLINVIYQQIIYKFNQIDHNLFVQIRRQLQFEFQFNNRETELSSSQDIFQTLKIDKSNPPQKHIQKMNMRVELSKKNNNNYLKQKFIHRLNSPKQSKQFTKTIGDKNKRQFSSNNILKLNQEQIELIRQFKRTMTFYKNLGSITFQYETQNLEIFSTYDETLIFQFKHLQVFDTDALRFLIAAYQFVLKDHRLLELYAQKNKPPSLLLHKASFPQFQRITIHILCQIIKQMATTIFQTRKISPNKIGEITKRMFFFIDGHLRYLYFPVHYSQIKQQQIVAEIIQFLHTLKDQKEISHRLLLKKISKCVSLESIIEETDYFLSIYHSKESTIGAKQQGFKTQENFLRKIIKNPYHGQIKTSNYNKKSNGFEQLGQYHEKSSGKPTIRRKYNLFRDQKQKSFRNSNNNSQFNLSTTWYKNDKQFSDQNTTVRSASKGLHMNMSQRQFKRQKSSFFQRASSLGQNYHKINSGKVFSSSTHIEKDQDYGQSSNGSFVRPRNRENSKYTEKQNSKRENQQNLFQSKQSGISGDFDDQMSILKQINKSQNEKAGNPSQWMKQMVNKSLEKGRQKSMEKGNLFGKIKHQEKEKSKIAVSRSRRSLKPQKESFQDLEEQKFNKQETNGFFKKNGEILSESTQTTNKNLTEFQHKLKRESYNPSNFVETQKQEKKVQNIKERSSQQIQLLNNKKLAKELQKLPKRESTQGVDVSFQRLSMVKSLIEQIAIKDKNEQKFNQVKEPYKNLNQKEQSTKLRTQVQKEINKPTSSKNKKKSMKQIQKVDNIEKNVQSNGKVLQFRERFKKIICQKEQIDFLGIAVVQTAQHLKSFESIFWQLPMFFLYKKFYEKRMQLLKDINQLINDLNLQNFKEKALKQLFNQVHKDSQQISEENQKIEESLKKLSKTVKKKVKKQYTRKNEQQYIEKHLHLDLSIEYDSVADEFISLYLQSLLGAKSQFPELVFHIIDIFEAILAWKGQILDPKQKESFNSSENKKENMQKAERYFSSILNKKEINHILQPESKKPKGKK